MTISDALGGLMLLLMFGVPLLLTAAFIVGTPIWLFGTKSGKEARAQSKRDAEAWAEYEAKVASTARVQRTERGWSKVTTRTFTVVQHIKTNRKAAIVHMGYHGRHYYLQPLLKDHSIGSGKAYWSKIDNWRQIDTVELPFIEGPADEPSD